MATPTAAPGTLPADSGPGPGPALAPAPAPGSGSGSGSGSAPASPPDFDPSLSSGSDPLTQLESALDLLLKMVASTVAYVTRKAPHVPTRPDAPLSMLGATAATILVDEQTMATSIEELVSDLVRQAGTVRTLIAHVPQYDVQIQGQPERLAQLQKEMHGANLEYEALVKEANDLQEHVADLLQQLFGEQQRIRVQAAEERSASRAWD